MRRIVIPTLMLMIGCATGAVVREAIVAPARAQGQTGPNYEYEVVRARGEEAKQVAMQYGAQGWRLVTATGGDSEPRTLYFERQKAH
jgi:hypothetical protein